MLNCSMLFAYATDGGRQAGFSESWYRDGAVADARPELVNLATARAAMLPTLVSIIGLRIQIVGGRSVSYQQFFQGTRSNVQDIPQMAVQCVVAGDVANSKKRFSMRAVADARVIGGDYNPAAWFTAAADIFAGVLVGSGFKFRSRKQSNPTVGLLSISSAGVFTLQAALAFNPGDFLTLLRVSDNNGKPISGNFYVNAPVTGTTGTFANWGGQTVGQSGKVRKLEYEYPSVVANSFVIEKIMTRKVGRPFFLYRGRARR